MNVARPGNSVTLLAGGDQYFPALSAAIAEARHEIHLETYIFADDSIGRRVATDLAEAAARGVSVRLLVDGFGSGNLVPALRSVLLPAGVEVQIYRPERSRFHLRRHRLRRLHRKLAVIDGQIGFCGGINIQDDRDGEPATAARVDFAVRVQGPVVGDMHAAVRRLWRLVKWTRLGRDRSKMPSAMRPPAPIPGKQLATFITRDNMKHRRAIENAYLDAIRAAQVEILLACAYFLPGRAFRRALRDAAARGVRVRLLLQGRSDHPVFHQATRALYGRLIECGIEIHEYTLAHLHAKVGVIDGRWATVGSSNIDPFSLLLSREANVVVNDAGFAEELRASLARATAEHASPIAAGGWAARALHQRLLAWVASQLARVFIGLTGYARREDL